MKRLWNLLFNAGLQSEEYNNLKDDIYVENLNNLRMYAPACTIYFLVLTIVSICTQTFAFENFGIYMVSTGLCLIFTILSKLKKWSKSGIMLAIYLFMAVLYAFGISITINQEAYPSVTFIVLLVAIPLLFIDRPIRLMAMTIAATISFVVLVNLLKENLDVIGKDSWNGISFGFVALLIEWVIVRIRLRTISQNLKIKELSELDLLTGVGNRNAYELFIKNYENKNDTITCLFGDVNGLHEMNNAYGHDAGDNMLKYVATEISKMFGNKQTFRIGGDEFISFVFNSNCDETKIKIKELNDLFALKNYHVSFGCYTLTKENFDYDQLLRNAEKNMYVSKSEYYNTRGIDRRTNDRFIK